MTKGTLEPPKRKDQSAPTGSLTPPEQSSKAAIVIPRLDHNALSQEELATSIRDTQQVIRAIKERIEELEDVIATSDEVATLRNAVNSLNVEVNRTEETTEETNIVADIELDAEESISEADLVTVDGSAFRADITDTHKFKIAGFAMNKVVGTGKVTVRRFGIVESLSWSWEPGEVLFAGVDGAISNSRGSGNFSQPVAVAISANKICAIIDSPYESIDNEPTGFPNRTDSTISFDAGTRTFSIAPVGSSFDIYIGGIKHTFDSTESVVVPDVTGINYIYFDKATAALTITSTFTEAIITEHVYVAVIYWNSSQAKAVYFGEERHGMVMDSNTHIHFHRSMGTQWINGLSLTGIIADGSGDLDTHAQLGYQAGEIRDEDISHSISADSTPAQMPVFYRDGTDWKSSSLDDFPLIYAGKDGWAGTLPAAALESGGSWSLNEVSNNNYLLIHVLATNDVNTPVVVILGQEYATKSQARTSAQTEFDSFTGLPFEELTPLGTVIFQCQSGDANTPSAHIVSTEDGSDYVDWRASQSFAGAAAVAGDQEVFYEEQPVVSYPAISFFNAGDADYPILNTMSFNIPGSGWQ